MKRRNSKKLIVFEILALLALAGLICVFVLIPPNDRSRGSEAEEVDIVKPETVEAAITLPNFEEPVYLCTDPVKEYYKGNMSLEDAGAETRADGAYQGLIFEYGIANGLTEDGNEIRMDAVLEVSEFKNFKEAQQFELDPEETSVTIDNLYPDRTYYYRVLTTTTVAGSEDQPEEETYYGQLKTANIDRFIYIDGLRNTRDIGGYKTSGGKTVKYDMIIRGTELDGLAESTFFLKDPKDAAEFGFVCDFDLRETSLFSGSYQSRLGKDVTHKFYTAPMYGSIFNEDFKEPLQEIFHDLADPENYPMYLHCTFGVDRTGTIMFLLQGILGVSEQDMVRQYLLSNFFSESAIEANLNPIFGGLEGMNGYTINSKIENFLKDEIGVTSEEIDSIRTILLEG